MIAKEKAKELVKEYSWNSDKSDAKQCALICVDEIIESIRHIIGEKLRVEYYLEVKQEIIKL